MKLTIFPAKNGDSIILETPASVILIDGGYTNTYKRYIKPKILELKEDSKSISRIIVTHIDNDHISGIIKFIQENKQHELIKIESVWHNSYNQVRDIPDGLVFKGKPLSELAINYNPAEISEPGEKNISAVQGSTLASNLKKYNYEWNSGFTDNIVCVEAAENIIVNDIAFKILSPTFEKLAALKTYWKKELYKKGYSSDENSTDFNEEAFEYILSMEKERKRLAKKNASACIGVLNIKDLLDEQFVEDETVTNGSAIAFIAEFENVKVLFLADAHPSVIIKSLRDQFKEEEFPVKFDLIKVSHHGSKSNTSDEILALIDSEKYIFSTNGSVHDHPDRQTVARIISRNTNFTRELYFNYPTPAINDFKNDDLYKKYNFKIIEGSGEEPIEFNL